MISTVISSFKMVDPALLFNHYQSSLHASVRWISSVSTLKFVEEIVNLSNFILGFSGLYNITHDYILSHRHVISHYENISTAQKKMNEIADQLASLGLILKAIATPQAASVIAWTAARVLSQPELYLFLRETKNQLPISIGQSLELAGFLLSIPSYLKIVSFIYTWISAKKDGEVNLTNRCSYTARKNVETYLKAGSPGKDDPNNLADRSISPSTITNTPESPSSPQNRKHLESVRKTLFLTTLNNEKSDSLEEQSRDNNFP